MALNLEKLAEHFEWDQMLVRSWSPAVDSVIGVLQSLSFQYAAALIVGAAVALWADGVLRRREPGRVATDSEEGERPTLPFDPSGLYVGEIHVSDAKLLQDYVLDITVRLFNATGTAIRPLRIDGSILLRRKGKDGKDIGSPLPPANLHSAKDAPHHSERVILIEQRLPKEIAREMADVIARGESCELYVQKMDLLIAPISDLGAPIRAPLSGGLLLSKSADALRVGRAIYASTTFHVGVSSDRSA